MDLEKIVAGALLLRALVHRKTDDDQSTRPVSTAGARSNPVRVVDLSPVVADVPTESASGDSSASAGGGSTGRSWSPPTKRDRSMRGPWTWATNQTAQLVAEWERRVAEWREAKTQYKNDRETLRGLLRLADEAELELKRSGALPGRIAPVRLARLRVQQTIADEGRLNGVISKVDAAINRAIGDGAPDGKMGAIPLIPIAAIAAAIAVIVASISLLRAHSKRVALETKKLNAVVNGALTADQLSALAETREKTLPETIGKIGVAAALAVAAVAIVRSKTA